MKTPKSSNPVFVVLVVFSLTPSIHAHADSTRPPDPTPSTPARSVEQPSTKPACRVFDRYVAWVSESTEAATENIEIAKRGAAPDPCASRGKIVWSSIEDMGTWFTDIYKDYLILDLGTSTDRGTKVIDLKNNREVLSIDHGQTAKFSGPGVLTSWENMGAIAEPPTSCLAALPAAWKKFRKDHAPIFNNTPMPDCKNCASSGLTAVFEGEVELNINSLKKIYTGKVRCGAME